MFSAYIIVNYLLASILTALISITRYSRRVLDSIALTMSIVGVLLSIFLMMKVVENSVAIYMFGGFRPPLGVVYYVDFASSALSLLSSFAIVMSVGLSNITMDYNVKKYFYPLSFLLATGVHGFLFAGDVFHLYVATELVAISSYALTAIYSSKRNCVRAAIVYGIAGTAITSFLLLSAILIYGSYGTVNIADIALKSVNPTALTPYTGAVFGEIVSSSALALTLMSWVFLFKSGIMPIHFWLPKVYRAAPIVSLILFTSSADVLGVYGILRLYYIMFSEESVILGFRHTLLFLLRFTALTSSFFSSLLVAGQSTVRGIVAYSTIAQLSLALAGVTSGSPEAVTGGLLHIIVNALGDTSVLIGYTIYIKMNSILLEKLAKILIIVGFINLFGLLPIVPGFWSKALMTRGFLGEGNIAGVAIILISAGLCAIGYLRFVIKVLSKQGILKSTSISMGRGCILGLAILVLLIVTVVGFSLVLTLSPPILNAVIEYTSQSINAHNYILNTFSLVLNRG